MSQQFTDKYGVVWSAQPADLQIEFHQIRLNYDKRDDKLLEHYLNAHRLLWPEDEQHRWFTLGMKSLVKNQITVLLGSASSGKTYLMSVHALIDFFCFPHTSLALVSSTEKRSLELKVWGRMKGLFNRAKARYDWLDGYVLESAMSITPDDIDDDGEYARQINKGIICVPCVSGGRFVGMAKFQGAKAPNSAGKNDGILKHYGDEVAVMQPSLLDSYSNWTVSPRFKGVMAGNPLDISDPLCTAAEPIGGWDVFQDNGKTQEWESKFYNAHVIAYDGRDTPNNDQAGCKYPFLATKEWVESLAKTHGEDSWQWFSQGIGKPSKNMISWRVITIGICEKNKAFDKVLWSSEAKTKLYALDPAYGGGDRCVGIELTLGKDSKGIQTLAIGKPEIIPIRINSGLEPEEQIAAYIKDVSDKREIPAENIFYDSFGRGTLGFAFAKVFGSNTPVPIDSGGKPSTRPVRFDLFVTDERTKDKRLKRCDEHYSKHISELWFSSREAIESSQIRDLPREIAEEGQLRLYRIVGTGSKLEVETKDDMKARIRKSPDLYDCLVGETLITTLRGKIPIVDVVIGDMVLTPVGYYPVVEKHEQEVSEIVTVNFSNGKSLCGKLSHRAFTKKHGWVRLDSLSIDNEMESEQDIPIWNILNLLFTAEENIGFKRLADIIKTKTGVIRKSDFYIELSGKKRTEIFQMALSSIIKTVAGGIIELKTLSLLKLKNISHTILKSVGKIQSKENRSWTRFLQNCKKPLFGTAQEKGLNGTAKTQSTCGKIESQKQTPASFVKSNLNPPASKMLSSIVLTVAPNAIAGRCLKTLKELVKFAARSLWFFVTMQLRIAPVNVQQSQLQKSRKVYDLSIAGANVYYANGILVENCFCIGVEGARRKGLKIQRIGADTVSTNDNLKWLTDMAAKRDKWVRSKQLSHK